MIIYLSLLVAIVGILAYALSANAKVSEIGRISYAMGLLAFLLQVVHMVGFSGCTCGSVPKVCPRAINIA